MAKKLDLDKMKSNLRGNIKRPSRVSFIPTGTPEKVVKELANTVANIPVKAIEANPFNPRKDFNEAALKELATSLKVHGLVQPITVRTMGTGNYQLISGERRWRASQMAGLEEIPAYIRAVENDQEMLEMALVENIQRENLNPVEVAITYDRLLKECNLTHDKLAERLGKARTTITHKLGLLELPPEVIVALRDKVISEGHAKAIKGLSNHKNQEFALGQIRLNDLSVRETEKLVSNIKNGLLELPPDVIDALKEGEIKVGHAMALCELVNIEDQIYVLKEIKRMTLSVERTEEFVERMNKKGSKTSKSKRKNPHEEILGKYKDKASAAFGMKVDLKTDISGKGKLIIPFKNYRILDDIMEKIDVISKQK